MQLLETRRTSSEQRGGNNGGFPEPLEGEPVRVVLRAHPACGAATRIRLPAGLPETVVQRVACDACGETFDADVGTEGARASLPSEVEELTPAMFAAPVALERGTAAPLGWASDRLADAGDGIAALFERMRDSIVEVPLPDIPRARLWAWASVPLALLGVIAGLALLQGDSDSAPRPASPAATGGIADAKLIEQPGYSLVLPAGWKRVDPPDGAVFAAQAKDGSADATLWIEREPELSFKQFEQRSLDQLGEIAEEPRVVDRVSAPTLEGTITELRADSPVAAGVTAPYRVTLRAAGPFRHYFATVQQPGADPEVIGDIELMHNSLRPEVKLAGVDSGEGQ